MHSFFQKHFERVIEKQKEKIVMSIAYKLFYTYQNLQSVHILCTYQLGLVSNVCKMIFDRVKLTSKSLRNKSTLKMYF